jgi:hypothetical protein
VPNVGICQGLDAIRLRDGTIDLCMAVVLY